jgi:hypothetical protein
MEQIIAKQGKLGTGQLILYSRSGFTRPARDEAERFGVVVITPDELRAELLGK